MKKYKPLTTAHWYIQKLERKADQFDAIMSKKIKSFLTKVSEKTLWETLGDNYTIYHPWYFNRKETLKEKVVFQEHTWNTLSENTKVIYLPTNQRLQKTGR